MYGVRRADNEEARLGTAEGHAEYLSSGWKGKQAYPTTISSFPPHPSMKSIFNLRFLQNGRLFKACRFTNTHSKHHTVTESDFYTSSRRRHSPLFLYNSACILPLHEMPDYLGDGMRKTNKEIVGEDNKPFQSLDENDIVVLKRYGQGAYTEQLKQLEADIEECVKKVNELSGVKESDTGLAPPALWDIAADKQAMQSEQPLQVARCTKIITSEGHEPRYLINVKQFAKFVVDLADTVAPTDIEEGMRVGVDRNKYQIHLPLPAKIDPSVTMMQVEEKPDVTYADVGGCKEQIEKLREVVETPLLHPERFVNLGIEPPKGVLLYGPPGTGKTLCARAVANRTDACFIRVIGSELVQKYVGEGARMVRELFEMARSKKVTHTIYSL
uniref:ATPase AAA-type core domain-containing protein n=1 Tax=Setaria digitata TaxID=48799 RepID=A0A915Q6S4_9BILA